MNTPSFVEALNALLAEFGERVVQAYSFVETRGAVNTEVFHRRVYRRHGAHIVLFVGQRRGSPEAPEEITELERWDDAGFEDHLLADPIVVHRLGLPAPQEAHVIDRVIARLRAGHVFLQSGADDGGRSDRGMSGGSTELRAEGGEFVVSSEGFYEPRGGPRETNSARAAFTEAGLRAALMSDRALRVLVGLPMR